MTVMLENDELVHEDDAHASERITVCQIQYRTFDEGNAVWRSPRTRGFINNRPVTCLWCAVERAQ